MITDWIMGGLFGILDGLFGLLPEFNVSIPAAFGTTAGAISDVIDMWVPVKWILGLLGAMLLWGLFRGAWFAIWWVYERIPFKSA